MIYSQKVWVGIQPFLKHFLSIIGHLWNTYRCGCNNRDIERFYSQIATLSGFLKKRADKFIPTKRSRCINLAHQDILRYYNSIIHGILNYYSFVNNWKSLSFLVYGFKLSCARTLALKYKLRYVSKVYKKFGSKLPINGDTVVLSIRSIFKTTKKTRLQYFKF